MFFFSSQKKKKRKENFDLPYNCSTKKKRNITEENISVGVDASIPAEKPDRR